MLPAEARRAGMREPRCRQDACGTGGHGPSYGPGPPQDETNPPRLGDRAGPIKSPVQYASPAVQLFSKISQTPLALLV